MHPIYAYETQHSAYIYIYIYMYRYIYMYTYICINIHTHIYVFPKRALTRLKHILLHPIYMFGIYIHIDRRTYVYVYMHTCTYMCRFYFQTCMCVCVWERERERGGERERERVCACLCEQTMMTPWHVHSHHKINRIQLIKVTAFNFDKLKKQNRTGDCTLGNLKVNPGTRSWSDDSTSSPGTRWRNRAIYLIFEHVLGLPVILHWRWCGVWILHDKFVALTWLSSDVF